MLKTENYHKVLPIWDWGDFTLLEYKMKENGGNYIEIGRFEPSSRLCTCGTINKDLKLSDRFGLAKTVEKLTKEIGLLQITLKVWFEDQNLITFTAGTVG